MADTPPLFSGDSCASPSPTADANRSPKKRRMIVYEDDVNQVPSSLLDTDDDEEVGSENLKPIGNVVRVSGVGRWKRHHFNGFEADGVCYQLEDTVLVVQSMNTKPSVAIIKGGKEVQGKVILFPCFTQSKRSDEFFLHFLLSCTRERKVAY
ncbi:hypothetical protein R6Q59_021965 [Mikania micrantha]